MVNADILNGDLVLIRRQPCADDGQIVAARVNGGRGNAQAFPPRGGHRHADAGELQLLPHPRPRLRI